MTRWYGFPGSMRNPERAVRKYNENHDELGRFTTGDGADFHYTDAGLMPRSTDPTFTDPFDPNGKYPYAVGVHDIAKSPMPAGVALLSWTGVHDTGHHNAFVEDVKTIRESDERMKNGELPVSARTGRVANALHELIATDGEERQEIFRGLRFDGYNAKERERWEAIKSLEVGQKMSTGFSSYTTDRWQAEKWSGVLYVGELKGDAFPGDSATFRAGALLVVDDGAHGLDVNKWYSEHKQMSPWSEESEFLTDRDYVVKSIEIVNDFYRIIHLEQVEPVKKYNSNHDELGRFASSDSEDLFGYRYHTLSNGVKIPVAIGYPYDFGESAKAWSDGSTPIRKMADQLMTGKVTQSMLHKSDADMRRAAALLLGVDSYSQPFPSLNRGISLSPNEFAKLRPGKAFPISLAGFTRNDAAWALAHGYSNTESPGDPDSKSMPILIEARNVRGVDITNNSYYPHEKEVIATGQYVVKDIELADHDMLLRMFMDSPTQSWFSDSSTAEREDYIQRMLDRKATIVRIERVEPIKKSTAAERSKGVIVALVPNTTVAKLMAVEGGDAPDQLHVTLTFHGDYDFLSPNALTRLKDAVRSVAITSVPLKGTISGVGTFLNGDQPCHYASVDVPALPEWRGRLVEALRLAGVNPDTTHGFTPHMTLKYGGDQPSIKPRAVIFNDVQVWAGGEHISYPLSALGILAKYNDNHDELGRFTYSGEGGTTAPPIKSWEIVHNLSSPGHTNQSYIVRLPDGSQKFVKPKEGLKHPEGTPDGVTDLERERAAYLISTALPPGYAPVPETDIVDTPMGLASVRADIKDFQEPSAYSLTKDEQFRGATFDSVIGNFDRHGGNVFTDSDGKLLLLDNGYAFPIPGLALPFDNSEFHEVIDTETLRSEDIDALRTLRSNREDIDKELVALLNQPAVEALWDRVDYMIETHEFTRLGMGIPYGAFLKYNENHDELGRFASGDTWTQGVSSGKGELPPRATPAEIAAAYNLFYGDSAGGAFSVKEVMTWNFNRKAIEYWKGGSHQIREAADVILKTGKVPATAAGVQAISILHQMREQGTHFAEPLFRGIGLPIEMAPYLEPGGKFDIGLASFSKSLDTGLNFTRAAVDYGGPDKIGVLLELENGYGLDVSRTGGFLDEAEVIGAGSYKIVSVDEREFTSTLAFKPYYHVKLEWVPDENPMLKYNENHDELGRFTFGSFQGTPSDDPRWAERIEADQQDTWAKDKHQRLLENNRVWEEVAGRNYPRTTGHIEYVLHEPTDKWDDGVKRIDVPDTWRQEPGNGVNQVFLDAAEKTFLDPNYKYTARVDVSLWESIPSKIEEYGATGYRSENFLRLAEANGLTPAEYGAKVEEHLREVLSDKDTIVATRMSRAGLLDVLTNGEFKHVGETGTTGSYHGGGPIADYAEIRDRAELNMFGPGNHPTYGYLTNPAGDGETESAQQYGSIIVQFNDDVKEKTTFFVGDSLDSTSRGNAPYGSPSPMSDPSFASVNYKFQSDALTESLRDYINPGSLVEYVETQIERPTRDDIAKVIFTTKTVDSNLRKLLESLDIPWEKRS